MQAESGHLKTMMMNDRLFVSELKGDALLMLLDKLMEFVPPKSTPVEIELRLRSLR